MSTNGMTSWAVDLADIGAIYPFQGWEFIMYLFALAFWLWWHWAQLRREARDLARGTYDGDTTEPTRQSVERY